MPSFVIDEKCDGCKGGDKTACMYICPNDLMVLDADRMKAYNSEPDMCWECYKFRMCGNCLMGPRWRGEVFYPTAMACPECTDEYWNDPMVGPRNWQDDPELREAHRRDYELLDAYRGIKHDVLDKR